MSRGQASLVTAQRVWHVHIRKGLVIQRAMKFPEPLQQEGQNHVSWRGRRLVNFSGCDYFRLSRHPAVLEAAKAGLMGSGLNVAASRLTTGHHRIYDELENSLARFFEADSALITSCGYTADLHVAQALAGGFSHVLIDEHAHPALADAARHFECPVKSFKHRDADGLRHVAKGCGAKARIIVLTDGMFSQDGSVAPLGGYLRALPARAQILVDDAHGAGVLGAQGRGTLEHEGVGRGRIIQCLSLSKALGAFGGAILCTKTLRFRIIEGSRVFMGSTALPPPLACAALESLKLLRQGTGFRKRLFSNSEFVKSSLLAAGHQIPKYPGPIIAIHPSSTLASRRLWRSLLAAGILPPLLNYSGKESSYYRFVISSEHTRKQLLALIRVLVETNWS